MDTLDGLMKVKVRNFNFIGVNITTTGFIAQELYEIYPEVVSVGGDDPKADPWGVDYGRLTPLLVQAVQDQQGQIEALKAENDALNDRVEALERLVCLEHPDAEVCG